MNPPAINLGNTAELYDMGHCLLDGKMSAGEAYAKSDNWQRQSVAVLSNLYGRVFKQSGALIRGSSGPRAHHGLFQFVPGKPGLFVDT